MALICDLHYMTDINMDRIVTIIGIGLLCYAVLYVWMSCEGGILIQCRQLFTNKNYTKYNLRLKTNESSFTKVLRDKR